jgi:Rieske Fe-S protein
VFFKNDGGGMTGSNEGIQCAGCQAGTAIGSVNRRTFLAQGTLAAVGAVLVGACGDGSVGATTGPVAASGSIRLSDFAALGTVGGIARVTVSGSPVAVVRAAGETYRAFSLVCPHRGTTVNVTGSSFRCPNHGATFSAAGTWTGGQRTSNLFEYTVTLNALDGTLAITS